ncbi:MAG: phenylalanine--tRNA ligase subunit beta [Acidaminococcaceae bacterium]
MLASINWMKEYVDIKVTPAELADKLTRVGLEVEKVLELGVGLTGVITGQVTAIERHPNSDHLWICQLNIGEPEVVQILTGAQNVTQGAVVPVAVVGSQLPSGMKLKKAKMRGLDSFGMLCSASELGIDAKLLLPEHREGILLLPQDTPIGVDIKEVLGLEDVVLDIDLTANRSDCFNMLGLAREAAVVLGESLQQPTLAVAELPGEQAADLAQIEIVAADLCSRFAVRVLRNIKIGESPVWMQKYLRACGMRPINNVVDVTNYVMLELGQPMHAYDYDQVSGHKLTVRRAQDGETLVTLDGQERKLGAEMLVIADNKGAVGLGGVMGGLATEVTAATTTVLLEAATFNGPNIRHTSKALGLRSEASGRFERGVDTVLNHNALDRAAYLLEQMGACSTVAGIVEAYPLVAEPVVVRVTPAALCARIGTELSGAYMTELLTQLGFGVVAAGDELVVTAPSWRNDVTCDADISEEVARINGFDNIVSKLPRLDMVQGRQEVIEEVRETVEDYLAGAGLDEVMTYSFIHASSFDKLLLATDDVRRQAIELLNPITEEFQIMRTTMAPSLLATASYNLARQHSKVGIFEIGRTFLPQALPLTQFPVEKRVLCVVLSGKRNVLNWNEAKDEVDFYDLKGLVEGLLAKLQVSDYQLVPATEPYLHPGKSCGIEYNGEVIGTLGEVHPLVQAAFNLSADCYLLEMKLEPLVAAATTVPSFVHLPKFPGTSRDLAVVVPAEVPMSELVAVMRAKGGELLTEIKVFDVYTGKQVAAGYKSMAFNLTFQAQDRTLTDSEIDVVIAELVAVVSATFAAKLRD